MLHEGEELPSTMAEHESCGDFELMTFKVDPAKICAVATDDEIVVFLSEDETVTFNHEAARLLVKTLSNILN